MKMIQKKGVILITLALVLGGAGVIGASGFVEKHQIQKHLQLGEKYLLDMQYEQAIVAFNKAIKKDPRCVEAYLGLAQVYDAQGKRQEAIGILEQAQTLVDDERIDALLEALKLAERIENPISANLEVEAYLKEPDEVIKLRQEVDLNKDGVLDYLISTAYNFEDEDRYSTHFYIIDGSSGSLMYESKNYKELGDESIQVEEIDGIYHILYRLTQYRWEYTEKLVCKDGVIFQPEVETFKDIYLSHDNSMIFEFEDSSLNGRVQFSEEYYKKIKKEYIEYDTIGTPDYEYELTPEGLVAHLETILTGIDNATRYNIDVTYAFDGDKWKIVTADYQLDDNNWKLIEKGFQPKAEDRFELIELTEENVREFLKIPLEEAEARLGASQKLEDRMWPVFTFENCNFAIAYGNYKYDYNYFKDHYDEILANVENSRLGLFKDEPSGIEAESGFGVSKGMSSDEVKEIMNITEELEENVATGWGYYLAKRYDDFIVSFSFDNSLKLEGVGVKEHD